MGRRASAAAQTVPGGVAVGLGAGQDTRDRAPEEGGKAVALGAATVRTIRHYWPELNDWMREQPDSRFQPYVTYEASFLWWWGILMFCCNLVSRRQLDYELRDLESHVLCNINRLAGTQQQSLPVHKTLEHFVGHVGDGPFAALRVQCIRRLIRLTNMQVTAGNVVTIATKGGRVRAKIENEGFNMQKNHGMNLEHAYSIVPRNMKAFYVLLQLAHIIMQIVQMGSLLKKLAHNYDTTPRSLFGSLKNIARRLTECLRYTRIPDEAFDSALAAACYIRLDTS